MELRRKDLVAYGHTVNIHQLRASWSLGEMNIQLLSQTTLVYSVEKDYAGSDVDTISRI